MYLTIENTIKVMVGLIGVEESCKVLAQIEEQLEDCEFPSSLQQFLSNAAAVDREKRYVHVACFTTSNICVMLKDHKICSACVQ